MTMRVNLKKEESDFILQKSSLQNAFLGAANINKTNLISLEQSIQALQTELNSKIKELLEQNNIDIKKYKVEKLDQKDGKFFLLLEEIEVKEDESTPE